MKNGKVVIALALCLVVALGLRCSTKQQKRYNSMKERVASRAEQICPKVAVVNGGAGFFTNLFTGEDETLDDLVSGDVDTVAKGLCELMQDLRPEASG